MLATPGSAAEFQQAQTTYTAAQQGGGIVQQALQAVVAKPVLERTATTFKIEHPEDAIQRATRTYYIAGVVALVAGAMAIASSI